jgi:hypothetical protein
MDDEHEHEEGHRHEGTFAEGQEVTEHHPEASTHGDFAEGEEELGADVDPEHVHRGGFAEGQDRGRHPEDEPQPDFGRGQDSN